MLSTCIIAPVVFSKNPKSHIAWLVFSYVHMQQKWKSVIKTQQLRPHERSETQTYHATVISAGSINHMRRKHYEKRLSLRVPHGQLVKGVGVGSWLRRFFCVMYLTRGNELRIRKYAHICNKRYGRGKLAGTGEGLTDWTQATYGTSFLDSQTCGTAVRGRVSCFTGTKKNLRIFSTFNLCWKVKLLWCLHLDLRC